MKKIKIFSPCDGVINKIEKINDDVFSKKMIGDGFFIEPSSKDFFSIIEEGTLSMITKQKNSMVLKVHDLEVLIHIGLETDKLESKQFNYYVKEGEPVSLSTKILTMDEKLLLKKEINLDTPVVIRGENYRITKLVTGTVKAGDQVCIIEYGNADEIKKIDTRNKFQIAAEEIVLKIGGTANINSLYNCMTRLRIQLKDKSDVNVEEIKKLNIVKGTNWIGEELQVIVGPEVFKLKNNIDVIVNKNGGIDDTKATPPGGFDRKYRTKLNIFGFINGIVSPILPIIVAAGLLIGLKSILEITRAIPVVGLNYSISDISTLITDYNLFTAIIYMVSQIGIGFVGMFFCISTVRYMKGNVIMGAFIAITIASPIMYGGLEFTLFKIGNVDIAIKAYAYSILPQIAAAFLYVYLDRWISKWIPSNLDLILRSLINYLVIVLFVWFLLGPVFGLIETGAYYLINLLVEIPYGFGVALAGFLWMPLVLTGTHQAIATLITVNINSGNPSVLGAIMIVPTFAQLGASIAVLIRSKNIEIRRSVISGIVPGVCGVIEPLLYSTNLQRKGAFLSGLLGGSLAMLLAGLINVQIDASGPLGIFSLTGAFGAGVWNAMQYVIIWLTGLGLGILFCLVLYRERPNENMEIKKNNRRLLRFISKNNISIDSNLRKELSKDSEFLFSKNDLSTVSKIEKESLSLLLLKDKLKIESKRVSDKERILSIKFNKLVEKNKVDQAKKVKQSIDSISKENLYNLQNALVNLEEKMKENLDRLEKIQSVKLVSTDKLIKQISNKLKSINLDLISSKYFNAIYSFNINYNLVNKKEIK